MRNIMKLTDEEKNFNLNRETVFEYFIQVLDNIVFFVILKFTPEKKVSEENNNYFLRIYITRFVIFEIPPGV